MSALTSLLVRDQVVPVRKIEEAIQRQVISGGEIEDVLLDMDLVPENVMSAYRAALFGLLPATRDEIMTSSRETIRIVPREVAEQYRLVPLSAEGRTLVVAVSTPLASEADEQLSFLLGHDLVFRVVADVRLQAALGHHYGVELSARVRRIADKLRPRDAGNVPYVAPPQELAAERQGMPAALKPMGVETGSGEGTFDRDTAKYGMLPEDARVVQQIHPPEPSPLGPKRAPSVAPPSTPEVGVATTMEVSPVQPAAPPPAPELKASPGLRRSSRPPSQRPSFRGPLSARDAVQALAKADTRDEIIEVLFAFARQFFDFAALFVVHDDIAEGRDAYGSGPSREVVSRIAVPLDVPGTFSEVRQRLECRVGDLRQSELDLLVCTDLQREDAQPSIVVPITIRGRAVLLLYGDQGGTVFRAADVPQLIAILPRVGDAFQRVILQRKQVGYATGDGQKRDSAKAAATRAVTSPGMAPVEDEPGPYRSSGEPGEAAPGGRVRRRKRSAPLDVLGVPRSAPPPPGRSPERPPSTGGVSKETRPDGRAAVVQAGLHPSEDSGADDEPAPRLDSALGGGPAFGSPAPVDLPPASASRPGPRNDSSYSLHNAGGDLVASEAEQAAPAPPVVDRRSHRRDPSLRSPDPRRDGDGSPLSHDVVHIAPTTGTPEVIVDVEAPISEEADERVSPSTSPGGLPSVIVDMGDAVDRLVDELIRCGPDDESAAVQALLSVGEVALPVLIQRFPGPLWFDRTMPHRRLPRGRDISALARAIVAFRERAIPYVATLLNAGGDDERFYAVLLSSEFLSLSLLPALAQRVFDRDPGTRVLVLDVLRHYRRYPKEFEEMMKGIRVEARMNRRDLPRRRVATRALGELADAKSAPHLIELLGSDDRDLVETAHRALVTLTRQDFGDSGRRWSQWLERNEALHRIEWLIDSLTHPDDDIRAAAGDDLKAITQEYHGYHPGSPKRDREIAQKKYRAWWEAHGKARFA